MSKRALGKGLEALIPQGVIDTLDAEKVSHIPIDQITGNPHQPRKHFDEDKIRSLAESIRADGVLQPVVVRKRGDRYELVMGERRLQAAKLAGVPSIPAIVRAVADADSLRLALVENLQREDLNPIEVAEGYRALVDKFGLSQQELADLVGKDRSSVANTLRLLALPEEIRTYLVEEKLSEGHARALLSLPTRAEQLACAERIIRKQLNVRQVEVELGGKRQRAVKGRPKKKKPAHIELLEKAMSQHLSTRVSVEEHRGGKGKIVIEFYSHDDFERLAGILSIPLPR
ncbi:MAG: ParB/RepB/Spo0J family partition protein [Candidatus Latescibacterota bacterium]|nr:MAG: ParB/RepB/Spo0J family partition protein [Candidatus Latescibacterota bacterium]